MGRRPVRSMSWARLVRPAEKAELSAVCSLPGITPRQVRELLTRFGSAAEAWSAVTRGNSSGVADRERMSQWASWSADVEPRERIAGFQRRGVELLALGEPGYPRLLSELDYPPLLLYHRGTLVDDTLPCVALVGSRKATSYGLEASKHLAADLACAGVCVVSGAAYGVDSAAHLGALESRGRTMAVLGCGPDVAYPRSHARLLRDIVSEGAVLSEYPPGTPPLKHHFPARNRIIAGLAVGVVVVEAAEGSGAMITADFALAADREVFAVPGEIFSPNSRGSNDLIRNGAAPATSAADILEALGLVSAGPERPAADVSLQPPLPLTGPGEEALLDAVTAGFSEAGDISQRAGMPLHRAIAGLSRLEVAGLVRRGPGGGYRATRQGSARK